MIRPRKKAAKKTRIAVDPAPHPALRSAADCITTYDITPERDHFRIACYQAARALPGSALRRAANHGVTSRLIELLVSNIPIEAPERLLLAELLAGELVPAGRPTLKTSARAQYRDLLDLAKATARQLTQDGQRSNDATHTAATIAAKDRRAGGKAPSTIVRDMQRSKTRPRV